MTAYGHFTTRRALRARDARFDDGMVSLSGLMRMMAESLVNEIMAAQAENACANDNQRNGYRQRRLIAAVNATADPSRFSRN